MIEWKEIPSVNGCVIPDIPDGWYEVYDEKYPSRCYRAELTDEGWKNISFARGDCMLINEYDVNFTHYRLLELPR